MSFGLIRTRSATNITVLLAGGQELVLDRSSPLVRDSAFLADLGTDQVHARGIDLPLWEALCRLYNMECHREGPTRVTTTTSTKKKYVFLWKEDVDGLDIAGLARLAHLFGLAAAIDFCFGMMAYAGADRYHAAYDVMAGRIRGGYAAPIRVEVHYFPVELSSNALVRDLSHGFEPVVRTFETTAELFKGTLQPRDAPSMEQLPLSYERADRWDYPRLAFTGGTIVTEYAPWTMKSIHTMISAQMGGIRYDRAEYPHAVAIYTPGRDLPPDWPRATLNSLDRVAGVVVDVRVLPRD